MVESFAIRPLHRKVTMGMTWPIVRRTYKTVLSPVKITIPIPDPLTQCVPCRAMFFVYKMPSATYETMLGEDDMPSPPKSLHPSC